MRQIADSRRHFLKQLGLSVAALAVLAVGLANGGSAAGQSVASAPSPDYQRADVQNNLPAFYKKLAGRLAFPYSWQEWSKRNGNDFSAWRRKARAQVRH